MSPKTKLKLSLIVAVLALAILACNFGGASEPTAIPTQPPTATEVTLPTEAPTATLAPTEPPLPEPTATTEQATPTEEAPPPPASGELQVDEVLIYRDDFGSLRVIGLVGNYTDRDYDNVEVEIEIFDANENSLFTDVTSTSLYRLASGKSSPFSLWVFEDLPEADHATATIVGQSASDFEQAEVELRGVIMTVDDDGDIHLTGALYNAGDQPVYLGGLAAATFEPDGKMYSADSHSVLIRYLDPGEDGPFRVTMQGHESGTADITEYELFIDASISEPEDYFDLTFSEFQNNYVDAYDSFHLVGEVTNNHPNSLSISLIAAIYDANDNVIDAASVDVPIYGVASGETVSYDFDFWGPLNYKSGMIDQADHYTVQWDPYWTWESYTEYVDISTANDSNEFDDYSGKFIGEVVNDTGQPLGGAVIVISMYEIETGNIFAVGYTSVFDDIADGSSAPYEIYVEVPTGFDPNTVEYVITAKGELP